MRVRSVDDVPAEVYAAAAGFLGMTFYHARPWHQLLEEVFGWRVHAVVAESDEGALAGFLPYVEKRDLRGRVKRVSLPLSHRVGPIFARDTDRRPFMDCLSSMDPFEIHDEVADERAVRRALNDITVLDLKEHASPEALFAALDAKSVRYMVKRAGKSGVEIAVDYSRDQFAAFERMELVTRHRLGSPMYPASFFRALHDIFRDTGLVSIRIASLAGRPVAGVVLFHFGETTTYAYGATDYAEETRKLGVNDYLLWTAIADSFGPGKRYFDFGTTPVHLGNLKAYKEKWRGRSVSLPYTYFARAGALSVLKRDGALTRLATSVLRSLPEPLFRVVSPILMKRVL